MQIFKFGNIYLNTQSRQVLKNGKPVVLTPKTFDVLLYLVENHGRIVSKDELLNKVWNGHVVEESNLAVQISKLRNLLASGKTEPLIETIPGSGYRFVAIVRKADIKDWEKHSNPNNFQNNLKPKQKFSDSIAVLPLNNEDGDEEIEYLADGLTESLINNLANIPKLKVTARNSVFKYKNTNIGTQEIGERLGVSKILTGRIKVIRDNIFISVELINPEDNSHLWGVQLNQPFSNIIKIQEEITEKVCSKLQAEIKKAINNHAKNPTTFNNESYRLFLKGKYFVNKATKESFYKAIDCFEQSVAVDPLNSNSYVALIETFRTLYVYDYISFEEVKNKIEPYLSIISKLNQTTAEVQTVQGAVKETFEWKFEEAENHYRRAIELNPNYLIAHYRYLNLLTDMGKHSAALEEIQKIIAIDPLSTNSYRQFGRIFFKMGQHKNALNYLYEALELEPDDYISLAILGGIFTDLEKYDEALEALSKSLKIQYNVETLLLIGHIYAHLGKAGKVREIIKEAESLITGGGYISFKLATIYLVMGEKEKAYQFLEKSIEEHDYDLTGIRCDPRLKTIYHEERFKQLISKIGFPANQTFEIE